jgi:hypothetical protein
MGQKIHCGNGGNDRFCARLMPSSSALIPMSICTLQCLFSHSFTTYKWLNWDCDVQICIGITSRWAGYKSSSFFTKIWMTILVKTLPPPNFFSIVVISLKKIWCLPGSKQTYFIIGAQKKKKMTLGFCRRPRKNTLIFPIKVNSGKNEVGHRNDPRPPKCNLLIKQMDAAATNWAVAVGREERKSTKFGKQILVRGAKTAKIPVGADQIIIRELEEL